MATSATLILLRHGQSLWNATNQFTGWVDVPLTPQGVSEAQRAGELLVEAQLKPDIVFTSVLKRAISTANIALETADRLWIPVVRDWRLNERHYGKLQGLDKSQIKQEYGDEQFMLWRRSYDTPPPPIDPDDHYSQTHDEKYFSLHHVPLTECLKDVVDRIVPYCEDVITAELAEGKTVLVVAHGNSLRALVKYLNGISDTDIAELNIPTGIPLVYNLVVDGGQIVIPHEGGYYLDPEAAQLGAAAVAQQGMSNSR